RANLHVADQHLAIITEGMAGAVCYGTARSAKLDSIPLEILGKTGTAEPAKGFHTNGWFVGFAAPIQSTRQLDPRKIELAVLVMISRAHGSEAAALAKPIFETYANEINHVQAPEPTTSIPRTPSAASRIRVHLVTENSTEELSLEDYV